MTGKFMTICVNDDVILKSNGMTALVNQSKNFFQ